MKGDRAIRSKARDSRLDMYGIAYGWVIAPHGVSDFDVSLISVGCDEDGGSTVNSTLHIKLKGTVRTADVHDISGILGLLWGGSDSADMERCVEFERAVADAILWQIEGLRKANEGKRRLILIQGPMLPKLRGRFQYRMPSRECVICTVTYQREWLRRMAMSTEDLERLQSHQSEGAEIRLGSIFPPTAVDTGARTWLAKFNAHPYQLECVTSTQTGKESVWVKDMERDILEAFKHPSPLKVANGEEVSLPKALKMATETCMNQCELERHWLSVHSKLSMAKAYNKKTDTVPLHIRRSIERLRDDVSEDAGKVSLKAAGDTDWQCPSEAQVRKLLMAAPDDLRALAKKLL